MTSEALVRAALDAAPVALIAYDDGGTLRLVNRRAAALLGRSVDELIGQPVERVIPRPVGARGAVVRSHGRGDLEVEIAVGTIDTEAGPLTTAVITEVSGRLVTEAARRRSEAHLEAAQRITHCGSWEVDIDDRGELDEPTMRWTDEVFRVFGYLPGEVEVSIPSFFAAVHPDDRARIASAVQRTLGAGEPAEAEYRVIRRDGAVRIVHAQSEPLHDEHGRMVRMTGTVQDVTEQRLTESQLLVSERMATIGTLAAGVAHEINNPMAALITNLELLDAAVAVVAAGAAAPPQMRDQLRDGREAADRIREIVLDLKVFSRPGEGDDARAPVDVARVLDSTLRLAANEIRHRAQLVRQLAPVPLVDASESRLGQVFLNLLLNAAQAIPEGHAEDNQIRVATSTDDAGGVVVTIADSGAGIPPALHDRIFTPFFTTKPIGVGTGLGLSICRRLITAMGGEIGFSTEVGRGTSFRIVLPAATAGGSEPAPVAAPVVTAGRRGQVLVVDDEPMITSAIARLLEDDHDVTELNVPQQALDAISGGARFDVILCDLMMPQVTGMDVYERLQQLAPDQAARLVLMTGGAFTPRAREFLARFPNPRVEKPFDAAALRALVDQLAR